MTVYIVQMWDYDGNSTICNVFGTFENAWNYINSQEFPDRYTVEIYTVIDFSNGGI